MKRLSLLLLLLLGACGQTDDKVWLGYGEGDNAFIGAPQPGWVTHLYVQRGQVVKRGDLLFTLDDAHERAARDQTASTLAQMRAALTQQQANLTYNAKQLSRQTGLARANAGTPTQLDLAQSNFRQSGAQITQAQSQIAQQEAALDSADYALAQRRVVAQTDGHVEDIYYREGEYVAASVPVLSVLPPDNVYVRFFVPESQLSKVHLGQKVKISCDGCAANIEATITFIAQQEEFTPPVIFSETNREKLVFKLEARAPGGLKLNPGQPVDVRPL
ncbi:MAG TPA: efflux RND transporter periplasmic adaptor subunit [Rhizomicrobium sp.]|jgi:HlyD family secretion protein